MAALGGDALGMELHAVDRPLAMGEAHDEPVLGPGGDAQRGGQARALDDQRMIARRRERIGQAGEDAGAVVVDAG